MSGNERKSKKQHLGLNKEGMGIIFKIKKFSYERHFTLSADHKAHKGIFDTGSTIPTLARLVE